MCGIIGCISEENGIDIKKIAIKVLNLLKNRGYDSCGLYLNNKKNNKIIEKIGIDGNKIKKYKNTKDTKDTKDTKNSKTKKIERNQTN